MLEEGAIKILKLLGASNYKLQAIQIRVALIAKDLFRFLIQVEDVKSSKDNNKALNYIQLAYTDGPLLYILAINTLLDAQKYLEHLYTPYSFSLKFILFKEFFRAILSFLETVENYLATI